MHAADITLDCLFYKHLPLIYPFTAQSIMQQTNNPKHMLSTAKDGSQVDKMRHIVHNNGLHSNAMITVPPPSPYSYDINRDNFSPSFLVLDDTQHPFVLYGLHLIKGDAFLEYARV